MNRQNASGLESPVSRRERNAAIRYLTERRYEKADIEARFVNVGLGSITEDCGQIRDPGSVPVIKR